MITTGIEVIDTAVDHPSIPLLINADGSAPFVVDMTPLDAIALGVDILESTILEFTDHPSGLSELSKWADRVCGIATTLVAALPTSPDVINLSAFAGSRITPRPVDITLATIGRLEQARDNIDGLVDAAKAERD